MRFATGKSLVKLDLEEQNTFSSTANWYFLQEKYSLPSPFLETVQHKGN